MKQWIAHSMLLMAALVLLMVPALAEEPETLVPRIRTDEPRFTDTQGVWCEENIKLCWQIGLLAGTSERTFSPENALSKAQVIVIAARLQDLLSGGTGTFQEPEEGEAWYTPALEHFDTVLQMAGITLETPLSEWVEFPVSPKDPACRRELVLLLSAALEASGIKLPAINEAVKIPDSADPAVHAFYQEGILNGMDRYGCFEGSNGLNRGQTAAILARILAPNQRLTFSQKDFQEFDLCRDVIQLDPDMVLFTVDGTDYTVLQYANEIITSADSINHPMHSEPDPEGALRNIREFCTFTIAPVTLAESVGVSLTETEEAVLLQAAAEKNGYRGLPSNYWAWKDRSELLKNKLEAYYAEQYGGEWNTEELSLNQFLFEEGRCLLESAVLSPNMDKADLSGIERRMREFPESVFH